MTSESQQVFVWTWLPGLAEPVVAGRLDPVGPLVNFTYGRSYLERDDAIPLYLPELPLGAQQIPPRVGAIAGCIADAGPDAWGQRVILNRLTGRTDADPIELGPLTYLIESGSDRIGALDFQVSPTEYVPRSGEHASLDQLAESAELIERDLPLPPELELALLHGSSVGGARPKALVDDGETALIAKFSSTTDTYPVVKGEFLAMELARRVGLDVSPVRLTSAHGRNALLVERFDRPGKGRRRAMVSALTMLGLDEASARYGSYAALADQIRARFTEPKATLRELFSRIVFNVLCSNTDDHPRNHAAFWDGEALSLTPAYDICPQPRSGGEAAQLMEIGRDRWRMSQVAGCVERASTYHLSEAEAREIVDNQIATIEDKWDEVCELAELGEAARAAFRNRQFLNPYSLQDYKRKN
ncbi:MAG TPA: HipA domain-containing protein [Solirubrobacterales bacterium]|jgi:serine/threonine-protein kinase HipA|nr:HipA domain-containing protein [Solirubrobacterales bacterium]